MTILRKAVDPEQVQFLVGRRRTRRDAGRLAVVPAWEPEGSGSCHPAPAEDANGARLVR